MMIRDVDRTYAPRTRARETSPLRKTAEGLGIFLDRLSVAVREARKRDDSVDSEIKTHVRNPSRGFKLTAPPEEEAGTDLGLNEEETAALTMLREARNLAADASGQAMAFIERETSQERLRAIFMDLEARRIEILSSLLAGLSESDDPLFSLAAPESAQAAYRGIDDIIMKFLDAGGAKNSGAPNGDAAYIDHETALSASEQLREFLLNEGPAKAFSRFREINRSNVLGLLQ